ncbi:MAG: SRPBCC family protein, partial [Flavobacteriaceae bacterium]|nr:SRPBCC family protein [Flavobacteriaceae bacterium]
TTILIIIGTIILVYAMLFVMASTKYEIIRSVIVDKPLPEVFSHITLLKLQDYWSPWGNDVEDDEFTHYGTDGHVGFKSVWKKKYKLFELEGEHEIIRIVEDRFIETEIRYTKPFKITSLAYMNVYEEGAKTIIYWGFRGKYKRPLNVIVFFIGLDKYFGRRFEVALKKIKHYIEYDVTTIQK